MSSKLCNDVDAVSFVQKYEDVCREIIGVYKLDVPVENFLGLAAKESGYGKGRIASELNNYFSMHAPAPFQIGEEQAQGDPKVKVAKFDSFKQSAQSFSHKYGGTIRSKRDPLAFAQALVCTKGCFNSGNTVTGGNSNFVTLLVSVINSVKARLSCKQKT